MNVLGSSPCKAAEGQAQVGEDQPGGGTRDGCLEVLAESRSAAEPGKATLNHPSPRQELEAFDAGGALDDLDRPRAAIGERGEQLRAAVDAVGEDMVQAGKSSAQRAQERHGAGRGLNVGLMPPT